MTTTIDYSLAKLQFTGRRKHLFRDQKYYISIFHEVILIGKKMNDQCPKYTMPMNLKEKIHWVTGLEKQEFRLLAFALTFGLKLKDFHANHDSLVKMWNIISCTTNFTKVSDFYLPQTILGQGSSARVFLCKKISNNELFAIKAINKDYIYKVDHGISSFETEVSILKELSNKKPSDSQFFINLHEVFEGDKTYYLVTDLMKGQNLHDEIHIHQEQCKVLSNKAVKTIMQRLLDGARVMHESQIIHRDLKPQNIMFEKPGQYDTLKIVDFGLATRQNVDQYLFSKCGTPNYVAPEILNSKDQTYLYSEVCDIFSCGSIFYKLLTGKNLFQASNVEQTLKKNKCCEIDFNVKELARIDKSALNLLRAMLQKNPSQRISAAQALNHDYFTGDKTEPHTLLLQPQFTKITFISTILPLIDLQLCEVETPEQDKKIFKYQNEYSPFGNVCKAKSPTKSRFDPKQSVEVNHNKVEIKKAESLQSENSMDERQGQRRISIHQLPCFKRPSCRSKSIQFRENFYTLSLDEKKKSLIIQLQRSYNSVNSGSPTKLHLSVTQKLSYANISSFYMKDQLSDLIKHSVQKLAQKQRPPSQLLLQNSLNNIKIYQQMIQSQQGSSILDQKMDFNKNL